MATEALFGVVSETRRMLGVLRSDTKQSALLPKGVEEATEWLRDALEKCRDDAFDPAAWLKVLFASDTSISGSLRKTHPEVEQTVVASVKRLVYCARCKQDRGAADTLCLVLELYLRDRAARSVEPVIRSMSKKDFDDTVQETIIRAWKKGWGMKVKQGAIAIKTSVREPVPTVRVFKFITNDFGGLFYAGGDCNVSRH